jgi:hypothetical protein
MEKWEYKIVFLNVTYTKSSTLNELGLQGWELCAIDTNSWLCIFKRKLN